MGSTQRKPCGIQMQVGAELTSRQGRRPQSPACGGHRPLDLILRVIRAFTLWVHFTSLLTACGFRTELGWAKQPVLGNVCCSINSPKIPVVSSTVKSYFFIHLTERDSSALIHSKTPAAPLCAASPGLWSSSEPVRGK